MAAMSLFAPYVFPAFRVLTRRSQATRRPSAPVAGSARTPRSSPPNATMDLIAVELDIDPLEIRRRNVVRDLSWTSPVGRKLDSGDYAELFALLEPEYVRLRSVQAAARAAGRLFGVGLGVFNEISASGSQDYSGAA